MDEKVHAKRRLAVGHPRTPSIVTYCIIIYYVIIVEALATICYNSAGPPARAGLVQIRKRFYPGTVITVAHRNRGREHNTCDPGFFWVLNRLNQNDGSEAADFADIERPSHPRCRTQRTICAAYCRRGICSGLLARGPARAAAAAPTGSRFWLLRLRTMGSFRPQQCDLHTGKGQYALRRRVPR